MKHIFWFQHRWKAIGVKHGVGSIISNLSFQTQAENVPMTEILYRCDCGAVKTKTIKFHWTLKQVRSNS